MKKYFKQLLASPFAMRRLENRMDDLLMLQACATIRSFDYTQALAKISDAEFKVFSQWGDDGIIQYLINYLDVKEKSFIEFGVENYRESNTRFLLMNNNWRGLIFDGSESHINYIRKDDIYWKYSLTAENQFITAENINELVSQNGFSGKIGILHIDIDGNDYWIWKAMDCVDADIVIVEYNAHFGSERAISVPYNSSFVASKAHYSLLYFGASLQAFIHLARQKGYYFAGSNTAGNNAYFVKNAYKNKLKEVSPEEGYVKAQFRQSRNKQGQLTFKDFEDAQAEIINLPVVNVVTGNKEVF